MKKLLVLFAISSVLLTACGGPIDEKQAYIDATVEATCAIVDMDIFSDDVESKMKDIYAGYGFPVDNDEEMDAIFAKYENDTEVMTTINEETKECQEKLFEGMMDLDLDMMEESMEVVEDTTDEMMEDLEEVVEDTEEMLEETEEMLEETEEVLDETTEAVTE